MANIMRYDQSPEIFMTVGRLVAWKDMLELALTRISDLEEIIDRYYCAHNPGAEECPCGACERVRKLPHKTD